jgi:CheY-like chemotaxis protein
MVNNALSGRHLLVVEDEMMVLMLIEDALADCGCEEISAAATVDEALALVQTHRFDAGMLDVNLDGEESYPVAEALAARGVPFFFATGYADHGIAQPYRDRPFLNKPFKSEKLVEMFTLLLVKQSG